MSVAFHNEDFFFFGGEKDNTEAQLFFNDEVMTFDFGALIFFPPCLFYLAKSQRGGLILELWECLTVGLSLWLWIYSERGVQKFLGVREWIDL